MMNVVCNCFALLNPFARGSRCRVRSREGLALACEISRRFCFVSKSFSIGVEVDVYEGSTERGEHFKTTTNKRTTMREDEEHLNVTPSSPDHQSQLLLLQHTLPFIAPQRLPQLQRPGFLRAPSLLQPRRNSIASASLSSKTPSVHLKPLHAPVQKRYQLLPPVPPHASLAHLSSRLLCLPARPCAPRRASTSSAPIGCSLKDGRSWWRGKSAWRLDDVAALVCGRSRELSTSDGLSRRDVQCAKEASYWSLRTPHCCVR